jgi:hypothetical protein
MNFRKVLNLPSANTLYRLSTLITAADPNAPTAFVELNLRAMRDNGGTVSVGDASMTSVTDGEELGATESTHESAGYEGVNVDASQIYLIAETDNQKIHVKGHTR